MIDFAAMFDQWAPSIVLQPHHRHAIKRAGIIAAASIAAMNFALALVVAVAWLVR